MPDDFERYDGPERRRYERPADYREADPLWVYRLGKVEEAVSRLSVQVEEVRQEIVPRQEHEARWRERQATRLQMPLIYAALVSAAAAVVSTILSLTH